MAAKARRRGGENNSPTARGAKSRNESGESRGRSSTRTLEEKKASVAGKEKERQRLDSAVAAERDLIPLPLLATVMICSGFLWILSLRDFIATGKAIGGSMDVAMLHFTKSTAWFDDSRGWKSTQGGLSTIAAVTTDENNMGGLYVRKMAGAAGLGVQLTKLLPMIWQQRRESWYRGHYRPLLWSSMVANLALVAFFVATAPTLRAARAERLNVVLCGLLVVETLVMALYLRMGRRRRPPLSSLAAPLSEQTLKVLEERGPNSVVSRIVMRTVAMVSTVMGVLAIRDLLFSGRILDFLPRDDIYLEWTNAFYHSPPPGSPEEDEYGLEAALHVGDLYISQYMALQWLLLVWYKMVSSCLLSVGADGRGAVQARILWRSQTIAGCLVVATLRLFAPAAKSASLDLRWHLMALGYETFIMGLYGFL